VQHFELLGRVDWLIFKAPTSYRQDDWLDWIAQKKKKSQ
jgi:hypothetical protein